ncbi:hypothetical protein ACFL2E_11460, partial [Thermodesulfobacteriota bacterium]
MEKNPGRKVYIVFLLTLLSVVSLTGTSYSAGQSSSSYVIPNDVLSGGGENMASTAYDLSSTQGQPSAIGISSSGSYTNSAGYWPSVFSAVGGQPVTHTLSVAIDPVGTGSVQAFGINCPGDCIDAYDEGVQITLTAVPAGGYLFDRWEGDLISSDNPLTLVLNADMVLSAVFIADASDGPATSTATPTLVTESSAMLEGAVNPNGLDTTYFFEYGTTGCLGFSTEGILLAAGYDNISVDDEISSLNDNTTYYFRLVASNNQGT